MEIVNEVDRYWILGAERLSRVDGFWPGAASGSSFSPGAAKTSWPFRRRVAMHHLAISKVTETIRVPSLWRGDEQDWG
jgi:hypothetical protein